MMGYVKFSLVLVCIAIAASLSSCKNGKAEGMPQNGAVPVVTQVVRYAPVSYFEEYPGTVVALNQIEIRPQVTGFVTGLFFKDGDHVSKGQKLYTIDPQLYSANYDQAVANLNIQQTNLVKAQKDADRYHTLAQHDAIAKQQVDYAEAALAAATNQVDAAKAAVASVQTYVRYATILAPFDGTIGISQVKTGTAVSAGQTLLNTVSTDDPMAVDFVIDQKEIYHFSKLIQEKTALDSTFTIAFGKDDIYPYHGKINLLDRAVDPQTGTLKVRLEFPNKQKLLRAGMSCTVRVSNGNTDTKPVITIPYKAITEQLGDYFVYVANGNVVSQRKVATGMHIGNKLIIQDGLKENDVIVVDGVQKLREGSEIKASMVADAK
jgi:membrane fusion protein (multidrug efflux system)